MKSQYLFRIKNSLIIIQRKPLLSFPFFKCKVWLSLILIGRITTQLKINLPKLINIKLAIKNSKFFIKKHGSAGTH